MVFHVKHKAGKKIMFHVKHCVTIRNDRAYTDYDADMLGGAIVQEYMRVNSQIANASNIYSKLSPLIKTMAAKPDNWWASRKRYGKLTENLIRSYVSSRLRDIKLKGRAESDKAIEKLISDKKRELPTDILRFVEQNRSVWAQFLYETASRLDNDALVGVFVPLIYGGVISRKNSSGEMFGVVDFDSRNDKKTINERINNAISAIYELKRRGITAILIYGDPNEIYSERLLSLYLSSPTEVFIIVERESNANEKGGYNRESGKAAYKREILAALGRAKNVFIILDGDGEEMKGKSGALSSYGVLHGFSASLGEKIARAAQKGSAVAIFDRSISLDGVLTGVSRAKISSDSILSLMPGSIISFASHPSLPICLPDLFELLLVVQFANSCSNVREIIRILV